MSTKQPVGRFSGNDQTKSPKKNLFETSENSDNTEHHSEFTTPLTSNETYINFSNHRGQNENEFIAGWPSKWKRFELLNRGLYNGKWANQSLKRSQDDWYLCQSIASQVGLSKRLKNSLWNIFDSLDMRTFKGYEGRANYAIQPKKGAIKTPAIRRVQNGFRKQILVIFCISAMLYNQNKSDDMAKYYPNSKPNKREKHGYPALFNVDIDEYDLRDGEVLLSDFATHHNFRENDIRSCMEKLRGIVPRL